MGENKFLHFESSEQAREALLFGLGVGMKRDFRIVRLFVGIGDSGEGSNLTLERLFVQAFDVALDGFIFDVDPDRANYLEARFDRPHGGNDARYHDPIVFAWSEAALGEYDPGVRKAYYTRIAERVNRDVPYVPLHWQRFAPRTRTSRQCERLSM